MQMAIVTVQYCLGTAGAPWAGTPADQQTTKLSRCCDDPDRIAAQAAAIVDRTEVGAPLSCLLVVAHGFNELADCYRFVQITRVINGGVNERRRI